MEWRQLQQIRNERCAQRHELSIERLQTIGEEETVQIPYRSYFRMCAVFLMKLENIRKKIEIHGITGLYEEELRQWNQELYVDVLGENYHTSFANPAYAQEKLSERYGQLLSFLYVELRSGIPYAYENRQDYLTILNELFLEIYQCFEAEEEPEFKTIKEILYWYASDYCDVFLADRVQEFLNPKYSRFAEEIIEKSSQESASYLYAYGIYIGETERNLWKKIRDLTEKERKDLTAAYIRKIQQKVRAFDTSCIVLCYQIGMEEIVLGVSDALKAQGIQPIMCRKAQGVIAKDGPYGNGYAGGACNSQYEADHRCDQALFLDKKYIERKLDVLRHAGDGEKRQVMQVPVQIQIGPFSKEREAISLNPCALTYTEEQLKWIQMFEEKSGELMNHPGSAITIPYEELEEISVLTKEGKEIILLKDGRFVIAGKMAPDRSSKNGMGTYKS